MDPIIGRLKDLSCNGLVMSGGKEEGALFGGYKATGHAAGARDADFAHDEERRDSAVRECRTCDRASRNSAPSGSYPLHPIRCGYPCSVGAPSSTWRCRPIFR